MILGWLLGFVGWWDPEGYALVFIGLGGGLQVEIGERNFLGALGCEVPEGLADDGVVLYLLLVLIAEHEDCGRDHRRSLIGAVLRLRSAPGRRVSVLISVSFFLTPHALLLEALGVHAISAIAVPFIVFVVRRSRISPPERIVKPRIPPGITPPIAPAVVSPSAAATVCDDRRAAPVSGSTRGISGVRIAVKGTARTEAARRGSMGEPCSPTHAARKMPACVSSAEASVTARGMPTATLPPKRERESQGQRRDRCPATHSTTIIGPLWREKSCKFLARENRRVAHTRKELHSPMPSLSMKAAMRSSWQTETGHLACQWSDIGQRLPYRAPWLEDAPESDYVPPVTDFASHSPFAAASWFRPHTASRESE